MYDAGAAGPKAKAGPAAMSEPFNRQRLALALTELGADLARRGAFIELAIYGGSAIMLQFEWRRSTADVDAVVREGYDETVLVRSVDAVSQTLGLDPGWLNNAVGMFTPLVEDETLFQLAGHYPDTATPGLRVLLAKPHYLLAMKLQALSSLDRGDRDLNDARALARHLAILDEGVLNDLYVAIHAAEPPVEVRVRFPAVLGRET